MSYKFTKGYSWVIWLEISQSATISASLFSLYSESFQNKGNPEGECRFINNEETEITVLRLGWVSLRSNMWNMFVKGIKLRGFGFSSHLLLVNPQLDPFLVLEALSYFLLSFKNGVKGLCQVKNVRRYGWLGRGQVCRFPHPSPPKQSLIPVLCYENIIK